MREAGRGPAADPGVRPANLLVLLRGGCVRRVVTGVVATVALVSISSVNNLSQGIVSRPRTAAGERCRRSPL